MAYLRRTRIGGAAYVYVMQSVRRGEKVESRILEYLGREDKIAPARLQKAITYWGVTTRAKRKASKPKGGKR
jgi:hypothetical protein